MFGADLKRALTTARIEAARLRHDFIRPEHLALGVLHESPSALSAVLTGTATRAARGAIHARAEVGAGEEPWSFDLPYAANAKAVIGAAMAEARSCEHSVVSSGHLLVALLQQDLTWLRVAFEEQGVTAEAVRAAVRAARLERPPHGNAPR